VLAGQFMRDIEEFCRGRGRYADVGYKYLFMYEEVFRSVGTSVEEVCEMEICRGRR
jgi:hypothetical protein